MATRHGDAFQQEERVGLKRKPTGPPRLLLGRTRATSTKDDEPETKLEKMENSEDGVGHCEAAGEGDDIRNRRRCRWWSRFSSAVICVKEEDGSEKPPQGALQDPNTLNVTERGCKRSFKEDKRFNLRMMTKRFTTSSDRQRGGGASLSFQKRLQEFFMRARQPVLLENMKVEEELQEEDPRVEEEPQVEEFHLEEELQVEESQVEESQVGEGLQEEEPQVEESQLEEGLEEEELQVEESQVEESQEGEGLPEKEPKVEESYLEEELQVEESQVGEGLQEEESQVEESQLEMGLEEKKPQLKEGLEEVKPQVEEKPRVEESQLKEGLEEEKPQVEESQVGEGLQEEEPQVEESQLKDGLQVDEPTQQQNDGTDGHPEELMVNQLIEDGAAAESPELTTKSTADDFQDAADGSETIQTTSAKQVLVQLVSSEEDQVFSDPEIRVDVDVQLSSQEKTELTTSGSHQPSTNRPTILIELCPPDDVTEEDEEEACCQGSSSQQNSLHLLLSFDHGERQLLQTARSLVRAAMTAAIDQLTREQQNGCMQREPQGCRDHA